MADETGTTWPCPKDGAPMRSKGRHNMRWRCPQCRGIFLDTEAIRERRAARRAARRRPPAWAPLVISVLISVVATLVARRRRRRRVAEPGA